MARPRVRPGEHRRPPRAPIWDDLGARLSRRMGVARRPHRGERRPGGPRILRLRGHPLTRPRCRSCSSAWCWARSAPSSPSGSCSIYRANRIINFAQGDLGRGGRRPGRVAHRRARVAVLPRRRRRLRWPPSCSALVTEVADHPPLRQVAPADPHGGDHRPPAGLRLRPARAAPGLRLRRRRRSRPCRSTSPSGGTSSCSAAATC